MADDTQGKATQRPAGGTSGKAATAPDTPAPRRAAPSERAAERSSPTVSGLQPENSVLNPGGPGDDRPTAKEIEKRTPKTYRATERGYVDGKVFEEGEVFTTKADQGSWMEPVKDRADYGVDMAVDEAQYAKKADVDYEGMSKPGLEALAALLGVTKPGDLVKDDLITAIKAARIPVAQ